MRILCVRATVNDSPKQLSQKFPKRSRLLKHADFQAVYQQGRKHFSGNVTAFYLERTQAPGPRVGFTVGKVLGGAVERNRIRRRMRAVVRRHLGNLVWPLDLVLHPKKTILTMEFARLDTEIGQIFAAVQKGRGR